MRAFFACCTAHSNKLGRVSGHGETGGILMDGPGIDHLPFLFRLEPGNKKCGCQACQESSET